MTFQRKNLPALFIGRFQPFHLGHLDAIRQILRQHAKIIIGIGSSQYSGKTTNPHSSTLRKKMIEQSLTAAKIPRRRFTIVKIPDIHDDAKWVAHVKKIAPRFETVWSGTPKVQRLFKKDGAHQVVAPKMRLAVSGTEIRRRMSEGRKWDHFVPNVVGRLIQNS